MVSRGRLPKAGERIQEPVSWFPQALYRNGGEHLVRFRRAIGTLVMLSRLDTFEVMLHKYPGDVRRRLGIIEASQSAPGMIGTHRTAIRPILIGASRSLELRKPVRILT